MRTILAAALVAFSLSLIPTSARADLAPPVPQVKEVKFVVEVDEKAKAPKVVVPQNLTTVRVRPGGIRPPKDGKEELSYLEFESNDETPSDSSLNRTHVMVAGIALALSFALGGLWLVRRQGQVATRGLVLLLAVSVTLATTSIVWANAAPIPPKQKERTLLPIAFDGKVNLEVTVGGDTIRLILDKDTYDKMKEKPKAPEQK